MWAELRKHALGNKPSAGLDDVPDDAAANRFNTYFAEVGHRIAEELAGRRDGTALPPRPPTVCSSAFTVRPATLPELSGALKRMSGSRATGSDGVSLQLIRRCFPWAATRLGVYSVQFPEFLSSILQYPQYGSTPE
ncbi:hypothetical protein FJT64_011878 [Amphibalanus amphitrite]|uniref:Uncharacterized protein n=1 Tax=Amphibalanus amphitrite TaxID=1232801 RepID=A0A6A4VEA4_AMPAM|nr:hypothetical protein FJT64_011878 [Amphibalanus amphitrite]